MQENTLRNITEWISWTFHQLMRHLRDSSMFLVCRNLRYFIDGLNPLVLTPCRIAEPRIARLSPLPIVPGVRALLHPYPSPIATRRRCDWSSAKVHSLADLKVNLPQNAQPVGTRFRSFRLHLTLYISPYAPSVAGRTC